MRGSSVRGQSSWQASSPSRVIRRLVSSSAARQRRLAFVRERQLKSQPLVAHAWVRMLRPARCGEPWGQWRRRSSSSSRFLCTYQRGSSSRDAINGATSRRVGASRSSNLRRVARFPSRSVRRAALRTLQWRSMAAAHRASRDRAGRAGRAATGPLPRRPYDEGYPQRRRIPEAATRAVTSRTRR